MGSLPSGGSWGTRKPSLTVQWLRLCISISVSTGSIPGQGTKISHPQTQSKKKKVEVLYVGSNPFASEGEVGNLSFLLVHVTLQEVECGKNVSRHYLPFHSRSFPIFLMCSCQSTSFWVSFRETCSMCQWRFGVSPGRAGFRCLLFRHLGLQLPMSSDPAELHKF